MRLPWSVIQTYILFGTVSKLLQIIVQFFAFDGELHLFSTLVLGELLNSGIPNLNSRNYKHCSIVVSCEKYFDLLNRLGVAQEFVRH